jgi:hypothetical protein
VGGSWLSVRGRKVDLLYRGGEAVARIIRDCQSGRIMMDYQLGRPRGFCSSISMGEISLCQPIRDPCEMIAGLKAMTAFYSEPLRVALISRFLWEVLFSIENGEIAIPRAEQTHIAGCVYRALCCVGEVLFALNGRYLINEKGAPDEAASFPITINCPRDRVANLWKAIWRGNHPAAFLVLRTFEREFKGITANR